MSYVNLNITLKSISFAIFDSHINYANLIWRGKMLTLHLELSPYRKKPLEFINNQPRSSHCESKILKFEDKILINNIIFKSKSIIYNHQYLRIGLSFVLIFTSKIQCHIQLINYLSVHIL